jgi:hypothetical protein
LRAHGAAGKLNSTEAIANSNQPLRNFCHPERERETLVASILFLQLAGAAWKSQIIEFTHSLFKWWERRLSIQHNSLFHLTAALATDRRGIGCYFSSAPDAHSTDSLDAAVRIRAKTKANYARGNFFHI